MTIEKWKDLDNRANAYKFAKKAGLIVHGKVTDEYHQLIIKVTGKERVSEMTQEEVDRFIDTLKTLAQSHKEERLTTWLSDPWSTKWMWGIVLLVCVLLLVIDQFVGTCVVRDWTTRQSPYSGNTYSYYLQSTELDGITWAYIPVIILVFNMISAAWLRPYIKRHGRNLTVWTTATIFFTPILTGIAYLLTWPSSNKNGQ
jgi:hypothetical protein